MVLCVATALFPTHGGPLLSTLGAEKAKYFALTLNHVPFFVVVGGMFEVDILRADFFYANFPIAQEFPYAYAKPVEVVSAIALFSLGLFAARAILSRFLRPAHSNGKNASQS